MKLKLRLNEFVSFVASLSLLTNSLLTPISIAYAQDATPTPEPTPIVEETPTPAPTDEPSPTPIATLAPEVTPTPEATNEITPSPTPEETVVSTFAPESIPTTPAPPEVKSEQVEATPLQETSGQATATPEQPKENGRISAVILEDTSAVSIPVDDLTVNTDGSATLQTDKLDYAPTDTVLITGTGFLPNKEYSLEITSETGNFKFSDRVTSDESGNLFYFYQLDGTYRPNYKVEVKNGSVVVASVTFTDNPPTPKPDLTVTKTNNVSGSVILGNSFAWSIHVQNSGAVTATLSNGDEIFKDNLPNGATYGSISYTPSGITGTINCNISSNNLICIVSGTVTIPVTSYFDLTFSVTPTGSEGTLENPRSGSGNKCKVDPNDEVDESNDGNNNCSDDVNVTLPWPTSWTTPNSCVTDPSGEPGVNPTEVDLVGSSGTPAVGFYSDSNYFYFRERVNGNPGTISDLSNYSWVVLFQTSTPQYQYLLSLSGKSGDKVLLYDNPIHSPDSGGVDFSPLFNDPADNILWEGSASIYARVTGSGPYYLDWAIPVSELTLRGINTSTTKFFATSTNANNYNKDHLQCYDAFADLSIVKSDNPDPVVSGGTLTYTLAVNNAGPDTASGVVVTDTLPAGFSVTSVTHSQGSCPDESEPSISCELGDLANGANATITIVGTIIGEGVVTNNASVNLDTTKSIDTNLDNNSDSEGTTINPAVGTLIVHKEFSDLYPNSGITINLTGPASASGVTDGSGNVTFSNLTPGSYTAYAVEPEGYHESDNSCLSVSVVAGIIPASCTITDSPILGTINVQKVISGTTTAFSDFCFTLSPDPGLGEICADGSGNVVFSNVPYGTYDVIETLTNPDYSETGNTCNALSISQNGDSPSCLITNTRKQGRISFLKLVDDGSDVSGWTFTINGVAGTFYSGDSVTLDTGSYIVNEFGSNEYLPDSVGGVCQSLIGSSATMDVNEQGGTCTFSNLVNKGSIIIIKEAVPEDPQDFSFIAAGSGVSNFTLDDDGDNTNGLSNTINFPGLFPDTYSISEVLPITGWDLTDLSCQSDLLGFDDTFVISPTASFNLRAGENIICTFTNTKQGKITACKYNDLNGNGQYEPSDDQPLSGISIKLSKATNPIDTKETGENGCITFEELGAGTYRVEEDYTDPDLNGYYSTNGATYYDVDITSGSDETRVFLNALYRTISGFKYNDLNGNGLRDVGEPGLGGWTIYIDYPPYGLDGGDVLTTTDGNGYYEFANLVPDTYRIAEDLKPGWVQTTPSLGYHDADVHFDVTSTGNDFGNQMRGSITIVKDANPDSSQDFTFNSPDQLGTFSLDDDADNTLSNQITFSDLGSNNYTISEQGVTGWDLTNIQCDGDDNPDINIQEGAVIVHLDRPGEDISCTFTNTRDTGSMVVHKIIDVDGNVLTTSDQSDGGSWEVTVTGNGGDTNGATSLSTGSDGLATFNSLKTGYYNVSETEQDGFSLVGATCDTGSPDGGTVYNVAVSKDTPTQCTFINTPNGTVHGFKWNDANTDDVRDLGEDLLGNWTINIYKSNGGGYNLVGSTQTDSDQASPHFGWYWFEHLFPGDYKVCEFLELGWNQSYPDGDGCHYLTVPDDNSNGFPETANYIGEPTPTYNFGNREELPSITIAKSNDKSGGVGQSDTVTYTLTLKNTGNIPLSDVIVKDVPAGGFTYIAGSTTINGVASGDPTISAGQLSWTIGDLPEEEEVVITYKLVTPSDLTFGIYTNFATCTAQLRKMEEGVNCDPTSSTVSRGVSLSYGGNLTPQVLGASTELPATGSSTWILILAGLAGIFGVGLKIYGKRYAKN